VLGLRCSVLVPTPPNQIFKTKEGIKLSIQKEEKEKFETKIVLENLKFLY